ncbi:MAG: VCBS repeat-containing protein [Ignavibacteriae bacterium]|nr:VCBS repeat-containing protein [Ignavibacteriota bacterium]
MTDLSLGYRPTGLAVGYSSPAVAEVAVISHDLQAIYWYELNIDGRFALTNRLKCSKQPRLITSFDANGDGRSEYITLSGDGLCLSVFKKKKGEFDERLIPFQTASQRFVVADINNNRRKDVILFGKSRAGATTLLARPDGSFEPGPTLFADISASDLKTTDLNKDGITDIVLTNWLSNQLVVFYGITNLIFSEQVTINLSDEPAEIDLTPVTREKTLLVAVTLSEARRIEVYAGNVLGEFRRIAGFSTPEKLAGVQFVDVNKDGFFDIVAGTGQGILVSLGTEHSFSDPIIFGAASSIAGYTVADIDGDKRNDVVLLDRDSRRLIGLANARPSGKVNWPSDYCVGGSPHGLAVRDFNGDGLVDIAVANAKSSTISVLYNEGEGRMSGQQAVTIAEYPTFVRAAFSAREPLRTLVTSHSKVEKLTFIRLTEEVNQSTAFSIPTGSDPYVVFASEDPLTQRLDLLVRYRRIRDGSVSLSSFEQLDGGQFIERSLRPMFPFAITALTVDDLTRNGKFDVIFSTHDKTTRQSTVHIGIAESGFDFKTTQSLFSYGDSTSSTRAIVTGYVNNDATKDILVSLGPPRNAILIAYGKGDGTFRESLAWIRGAYPVNDDAIVIQDVNNDDINDLVFVDGNKKGVVVLYGGEHGGFRSPISIVQGEGIRSVRVASLRQPKIQDLILSDADKGIVSIIYNPFRK